MTARIMWTIAVFLWAGLAFGQQPGDVLTLDDGSTITAAQQFEQYVAPAFAQNHLEAGAEFRSLLRDAVTSATITQAQYLTFTKIYDDRVATGAGGFLERLRQTYWDEDDYAAEPIGNYGRNIVRLTAARIVNTEKAAKQEGLDEINFRLDAIAAN